MDFEQVLSHDSVLLESEGRHCRKKEALRCSEINTSIFLSTEELNEVANQNTCVYVCMHIHQRQEAWTVAKGD